MLWLALHYPDLPLEAVAAASGPAAVQQGPETRPSIVRANAAAAAAGVRPGQAVTTATTLCPALVLYSRAPRAEAAALHLQALWAQQFSPRLAQSPPAGLVVEIGASLRLFGGIEAFRQRLEAGLEEVPYRCGYAIAPTPLAAEWHAALGRPAVIMERRALRAALDELPAAVLTGDEAVRERLAGLGIGRIAELRRLPRRECARRLGTGLMATLDRALGRRPDPRVPFQSPAHFRVRLPLPAEVAETGALLFAVRRLVQGLSGHLRAREAGVTGIALLLEHPARRRSRVPLGLTRPSRDPEHLLSLFKTRLENCELAAPVTAVTLDAERTTPLAPVQGELFTEREPEQPDPGLLDRLQARLGPDAVTALVPTADARPERASRWTAVEDTPPAAVPDGPVRAHQPLWLLGRPAPLAVEAGRPRLDGPLRLTGTPERIETGWWDGGDVIRDYFVAEDDRGARLWVYRERRSGRWYLQGLFG